jgi:hypothetical protein
LLPSSTGRGRWLFLVIGTVIGVYRAPGRGNRYARSGAAILRPLNARARKIL